MKKKILFLILLIFAIAIIGTTYSWHKFRSNDVDVAFEVDDTGTITYSGGADISGIKLIPVSSKEKGETDGTGIAKTISVNSTKYKQHYFDLNLYLEEFPLGLKDQSLRWEIYKGNTLFNSGNFGSVNQGDSIKLIKDYILSSTTTIFKLYIWIDGLQDNPDTIVNQHFKFVLNGEATDEWSPVIASDYIISLSQGDTYTAGNCNGVYATNSYDDNGVTKYHEYRYVGGEVNNYVSFNNELYRIIGVFDSNSTGVNANLVKLISAKELTSASWGAYNSSPTYTTYSTFKNDWTGNTTGVPASANLILNEYFYNASSTSTTYGECINWTYVHSNDEYKSKNCSNIVGYGIQTNDFRNFIQPVTWYLYGYSSNELNKQDFYNCERNNYSGCTSAHSGIYQGTTTANIGLMYVSDYMYASGYIASNDTTTLGNNMNWINSNWLYNGFEWTITPVGYYDASAFCVSGSGSLYYNGVTADSRGLRPSFYLKSNIKITSGDGSFANPYIIG